MAQPTDQLDPLSRFLSWVTYTSAVRPKAMLAVACVITAAAVLLAATRLEFRTSRLDLLSASASYNQRWLAYLDKFGRQDDAVVIVSHNDPQRVAEALTAIGQRLEADSELHGVMFRQSMGQVADKALGLLPPTELEKLDQLLAICARLLPARQRSATAPAALTHLPPPTSSYTQQAFAALAEQAELAELKQYATAGLVEAVAQVQAGLDQLKQSVPREGPLLLEDEGRLGLCLLSVPHLDDEPIAAPAQLKSIDAHLQAMRQAYPDVQFGLTGMPVLEWDESQSSQNDMQKATLLSLLGVAVIFVFGFGSWRMPCAAVFCLAIGLTWTVGLATLIVGHLNLFSVAFGAIIAGLGIDYAIHLLTRLLTQDRTYDEHCQNDRRMENNVAALSVEDCRSTFERPELSAQELPDALARAVAHCGKGIFTGAVTTAAAFAVAVLTPFRGMTELGVICAVGTIACMTVTIWVMPAVLSLQASWGIQRARQTSRPRFSWLAGLHHYIMLGLQWSNKSNIQWRVPVLLSTLCITVMSGMQMGRLKYDHNLLNLQAENAPSVQAEHELTSRSQHSAWFAVSMAPSAKSAKALRQRLEKLSTVARVEELGSLIATGDQPRTAELINACRMRASLISETLSSTPTQPLAERPSPDSLLTILPASYNAAPAADMNLSINMNMASQLQRLTHTIQEMSSAATESALLSTADFPSAMRARMISQDGETYLLRIYARHDLWQRENLGAFVRELESVDPRVTGHPIQTWYASAELENSYYQAGIYALLAVIALLMIDLGSLRLVALALVPVAISAVQLCGWLIAWHIPFNAANMIVLPLIIGIGIDDGVHIMHDFAQRGSRQFRLSASTTLAVLLTSLTTMVGFGSMAVADHRGLYSLGIVLMTGVGLCLWHSWFTLPAILSFLGPIRSAASATESVMAVAPINDAAHSVEESTDSGNAKPLLLRDIPIVLSLPDYPELRT